MGEKFTAELEKIEKIKTYSKRKQVLCDDMASGFLIAYSDNTIGLDQGLIRIKTMRKMLRAKGYSPDQVNDFIVERAYVSKADIKKIFNESIYNFDDSLRPEVEQVEAHNNTHNVNDLLIDVLKSKPALLKALRKGTSEANLRQNYNISNSTLLINFYNANKNIIDM